MQLITERKLSYAIGISRPTLAKWRKQGIVTPIHTEGEDTKARYFYDKEQALKQAKLHVDKSVHKSK